MKRLLHAVLLLCLTASTALAQTGTPQTKGQLNTETVTNFPDNTSGAITPAITRQSMVDYIASWQQATSVNAQTGTTYTIDVSDFGKLVTFSNASAVAVTLPQGANTFANFNFYTCNKGAGLVTITPTTSTINGLATLTLSTNQCTQVVSDGTNYQIFPQSTAIPPSFTEPAFQNCSLAASVGSNLLTVALKDAAGNDPTVGSKCTIAFRSATATTGTLTARDVTAALSVNTNAVGASLGSSNSTAFRLWVVAFDNAGTVVLGLYNASNSTSCIGINEEVVQSSTPFSGSANAIGTFYTPNGTTVTSKAIKILGYVEYNATGLATAGTYATAPNFIQVLGSATRRPCDQVQVASATITATDVTASNSYVVTSTTASLTPRSAANPMVVSASGTCFKNTASNGFARLSRGSTNNTNMIGSEIRYNFGAVAVACALGALDLPNTASSQAYTVQFKSDSANNTNWGDGRPAIITIAEIMG